MLRNCLKKGFRPASVLVVAVLMCSLGGCSDSESGWLKGRAFTMNAYSNTGELTLTIDFSPRLKPGDSKL